jgi:hypothetical protein
LAVELFVRGLKASLVEDPVHSKVVGHCVEISHYDDEVFGLGLPVNPVYNILHLVQADLFLLNEIVQMEVQDVGPGSVNEG